MEDKRKPFLQRAENFLAGKGFYIVLSVCFVIIGISAWMLFRDDGTSNETYVDNSMLSVSPDIVNTTPPADSSVKKDTDKNDSTQSKPSALIPDTNTSDTYEDETIETMSPAVYDEDTAEETVTVEKTFIWPVSGDISVGYYKDSLVYNKTMMDWRTHTGVDISADIGTKVFAASDGTVEKVYDDDMFGTTVVIAHAGGLKTVYSNMAGTPTVKEGDNITLGSVIGSVGDTALAEMGEVQHLHFAMMLDDEAVDPLEYLPQKP